MLTPSWGIPGDPKIIKKTMKFQNAVKEPPGPDFEAFDLQKLQKLLKDGFETSLGSEKLIFAKVLISSGLPIGKEKVSSSWKSMKIQ